MQDFVNRQVHFYHVQDTYLLYFANIEKLGLLPAAVSGQYSGNLAYVYKAGNY